MATQKISIINGNTMPDASGKVYFQPLSAAFDTGTPFFDPNLIVFAVTASVDIFLHGHFTVPENYVGAPVVRTRFATVGGSSLLFAAGFAYRNRTATESWAMTSADEDDIVNIAGSATARTPVEISFTGLTAANFKKGDGVFFRFYRDDSVDTIPADIFIADIIFEYSDA